MSPQREQGAEAVILALCAGYLGQDGHGAGLLVRRNGRLCTPRCPRGQWLQPGDSQRGGQPCSDRCRQIAEAIAQAAEWLKTHEREPARLVPSVDPAPARQLEFGEAS